jgi:hypothetical protein
MPTPHEWPMTATQVPFQALADLGINPNSCDRVAIDGRVSAAVMRRAIEAACARHPLTGCVVEKRGGRWFWVRPDAPPPLDLRVEDLLSDRPDVVDDHLMRAVWSESIPLEQARPVRFHLLRTPTRSVLQVVGPHACTDARSGTVLMQDIADAFTALQEGRAPATDVIEPSTDLTPWTDGLSAPARAGLWLSAAWGLLRDMIAPGAGVPLADRAQGETRLERHDVDADLFATARAAAKAHGVTLHALFLVALRRTLDRHAGSGRPYRIADLATLRPYADRDLGAVWDCLVVPTIGPLPAVSGEGPTAVRTMAARIRRTKSREALVALFRARLYGGMVRWLPLTIVGPAILRFIAKTNVVLTNPGRISVPLERFGRHAVLDFVNFPQLFPPGRVCLIPTTFRDTLRVLCLSDSATWPDGARAAMLTPFVAELETLVEQLGAAAREIPYGARNSRSAS